MLATPVTTSVEHDFASKSEANHDSLHTPLNALIPCHFHGFFVFFLPPAGPMQIGLAGRRAPILGDDGVLKRPLPLPEQVFPSQASLRTSTIPSNAPQTSLTPGRAKSRLAGQKSPLAGQRSRLAGQKSVGRAKKSVGRAKKSVGRAKKSVGWAKVGWPGNRPGGGGGGAGRASVWGENVLCPLPPAPPPHHRICRPLQFLSLQLDSGSTCRSPRSTAPPTASAGQSS